MSVRTWRYYKCWCEDSVACKTLHFSLQRGTFRPRLTELVQQNTSSQVEKVTGDAIAALPNMETAIKLLTQLKAVGPATASGLNK